MKRIGTIQILLLLSFALLLDAASRIAAQPGYVAKGVIAPQRDGTMLVDTTPCAGAAYKRYVLFRPDYRVEKSTSIRCPGNPPYPQFVVYQGKFR